MASDNVDRVRFLSSSPDETRELGRVIGEKCRGGEVILLTGPLGAGKTTFVQGLARGLLISGPVQSPSFVLERIHRGRLVLRHLDLYRLCAAEVDDAGLLSDIQDTDVTVIEWADRVFGDLDAELVIDIQEHPGDVTERSILIEARSYGWESFLREVIAR